MSDYSPSFFFAGDQQAVKTPEDLARKRALVDAMLQQDANSPGPRNLGEGLSAIGKALMIRQSRQGLAGDESRIASDQTDLWNSPEARTALGIGGTPQPTPPLTPVQPQSAQVAPSMGFNHNGGPMPPPNVITDNAPNPAGAVPVGPINAQTGQAAPINPNMPPALSGGQQMPVQAAPAQPVVPQGAASGQLQALLTVANDPRFPFASPVKQKMVLDQIQAIQAQNFPKPTDDILEYQFAKKQGFDGSLQDWITTKKSAGAKGQYGVTPQYGVDKDGNAVLLQMGSDGSVIQPTLPNGVTLSNKTPIKLDAGTHWVILDPITRQQVAVIPKDLAGAASATEQGKISGQAQGNIPPAQVGADYLTKNVDDLLNDKELGSITGWNSYRPDMVSSNKMIGLRAKLDAIKGQGFLEVRQALKGGGQITDYEGQKAESSLASMDRAIQAGDTETFKTSLRDYKAAIQNGMAKLRATAGGTPQISQSGGIPDVSKMTDEQLKALANGQ